MPTGSKLTCSVCQSIHRKRIDEILLDNSCELEEIAVDYSVLLDDLKLHAILHTQEEKPSITRQIKLKEADMLTTVANDYLTTMLTIGARINGYVKSDELGFDKLISRQIVELYLGTGAEIRQTVKALADLNTQINGENNSAKSGLHALTNALNVSAKREAAG